MSRRRFELVAALSVLLLCSACGRDKRPDGTKANNAAADMGVAEDASTAADAAADPDAGDPDMSPPGPTCIDPASVPSVGLSVGTCAAPQPCEGAFEDEWTVIAGCVTARDVMPQLFGVCNTAVVRALDSRVDGTVTITDGMLSATLNASFEAQVTLPNNCTGCRCADAEAALNAAGVGASCNPTCAGGDCFCDVSGTFDDTVSEPYTASGGVLTTDSGRTFSICAEDGFARFGESTDGAVGAWFGLAADALPEVCNGLDDDADGAVDEDPRDCPPCSDFGVCADGVEATCTDGRWACSYTAGAWEQDEATCDTLDNDCDGEVDEADGCERCDGIDNDQNGTVDDAIAVTPPDCWSRGVCASGGTPRCGGTAWWTCDYDATDFSYVEQSCDLADNDCDGVVDNGCCPAADSAIFFSRWDGAVDQATVYRIGLDGSDVQAILQTSDVIAHVAYAPGRDQLYWARYTPNASGGQVQRADLDGTNVEVVVTTDGYLGDLDVSPGGDELVYLDGPSREARYVADLTAPDDYVVVQEFVSKLWMDWRGGFMYFQQPNTREVSRIGLDGTQRQLLFEDIELFSMAHDYGAGVLYSMSAGRLYSGPLAGGNLTTVIDTPVAVIGSPHQTEWDPGSGLFYFGTTAPGIDDPVEVGRFSLDGSVAEVLFSELGTAVQGLAIKVCTQ